MGKASMSARSPTARVPLPRCNTPTTPVWPMPRCTSSPKLSSRSATRAAVRVSAKPSSGWAWKSCRHAVISADRWAVSASGIKRPLRCVPIYQNDLPDKLKFCACCVPTGATMTSTNHIYAHPGRSGRKLRKNCRSVVPHLHGARSSRQQPLVTPPPDPLGPDPDLHPERPAL